MDYIQVELTVNFQYFLREEDLQELHDTYNLDYAPVLESTALVIIKVNITNTYLIRARCSPLSFWPKKILLHVFNSVSRNVGSFFVACVESIGHSLLHNNRFKTLCFTLNLLRLDI